MSEVQIAIIDQEDTQITLAVPGVQGPVGNAIPSGGTTNQVLFKSSATNYDATWGNVTSAMITDLAIVDADVSASAAIVDTKLATIATALKVSNSATTAASANTASAIVARDASGNFTAGTITAALTGAASSNVLKAGDTMTGALVVPLASASTPSLTFTGDLNTGIYSPGADQLAVATNGSARLYIASDGKVGVGTTSPGAILHTVNTSAGAATVGAFIQNSSITAGTEVRLGFAPNTNVVGDNRYSWIGAVNGTGSNDSALTFATAPGGAPGVERMRITSAGLVGIGTSSPTNYGAGVNNISINGSAGGIADFYFNGTRQGWIGTLASNQMVVDTAGAAIPLTLRTNGNAALTIDTSQRVGIGTTSPSSVLHLAGSSPQLILDPGSGSTDPVSINSWRTNAPITFRPGDTERARFDGSGRLLVGTSSTSSSIPKLIVSGGADGGVTAGILVANTEATPTDGMALGVYDFSAANHSVAVRIIARRDGGTWTAGSSQPTRLEFSTTADGASSPTERMRITSMGSAQYAAATTGIVSGSVSAAGTTYTTFIGQYDTLSGPGTGTNSFLVYTNGNVQNTNNSYGALSDIKLKENIIDANSQWDDIKALQVRKYNFKEETGHQTHTQLGLIAQEVELISPGLVTESPDRDAEGNDLGTVTKSVNYSVLYMKAVKALQEAMGRIETLEQRLAAAGID